MGPELYKMTMDVVSDAIKILGPALITAVVGYKAGKSQLLLKIEELNKNNEFKAREKIFDFHKEKLAKADKFSKIYVNWKYYNENNESWIKIF